MVHFRSGDSGSPSLVKILQVQLAGSCSLLTEHIANGGVYVGSVCSCDFFLSNSVIFFVSVAVPWK